MPDELQRTAILRTAHILKNILTWQTINFIYIFQKLLCNEPQGQVLTLILGYL
jgi:hypothetical protein